MFDQWPKSWQLGNQFIGWIKLQFSIFFTNSTNIDKNKLWVIWLILLIFLNSLMLISLIQNSIYFTWLGRFIIIVVNSLKIRLYFRIRINIVWIKTNECKLFNLVFEYAIKYIIQIYTHVIRVENLI